MLRTRGIRSQQGRSAPSSDDTPLGQGRPDGCSIEIKGTFVSRLGLLYAGGQTTCFQAVVKTREGQDCYLP